MSSALVTEESPPPAFLSLPVAAFSSQTDRRPDSRSTVALMSTTGRAAVSGRMKGPGQAPRRLSRPAPKRGGDAALPTPESPDTPPPPPRVEEPDPPDQLGPPLGVTASGPLRSPCCPPRSPPPRASLLASGRRSRRGRRAALGLRRGHGGRAEPQNVPAAAHVHHAR
ncbi:unnamed protein product [Lampetra planeri]